MNTPRFSIGGLCLLAGCTNAGDGTDLESVVARHVEARGGQAAIEAVQSFETDIRIVEPTVTVDGRYVATRVNPEPEWIETVYDDYRAVDGVMHAHRQTERRLDSGELLATGTVGEIRLNRPVSDAYFHAP